MTDSQSQAAPGLARGAPRWRAASLGPLNQAQRAFARFRNDGRQLDPESATISSNPEMKPPLLGVYESSHSCPGSGPDRLSEKRIVASLSFCGADRLVETIDLDTVRRWNVYIYDTARQSTEPFAVSSDIGFEWSPVDAARARTPAKKTSSRNWLTGGNDRSKRSTAGRG